MYDLIITFFCTGGPMKLKKYETMMQNVMVHFICHLHRINETEIRDKTWHHTLQKINNQPLCLDQTKIAIQSKVNASKNICIYTKYNLCSSFNYIYMLFRNSDVDNIYIGVAEFE